MQIPLLTDILIIFALGIVVLLLCHRIRMPAIVGFLLTGLLAGPHGFALIAGVHEVEVLAEIGVVLLLFTIGIEFSMQNLLQLKKPVLLGGSFQVFVTLLVTFVLMWAFGHNLTRSLFMGFLISLSSTAIVLKLFQERSEMQSPYGKIGLAILIFQDIAAVPMMLLTPLMAGEMSQFGLLFLMLVLKTAGVILLVFVTAKWVVPRILYQVANTRSRELFLLTIVVICLAVAWLTSSIGLSLALGAFLAGLIISESQYSIQALSSLLPFRDVFTSIFFISIGMLVDLSVVVHNPGTIAAIVLAVMVAKALIAGSSAMLLGYSFRTMILLGLALCQVGEFSFIISKFGLDAGLLSPNDYQIFLSMAVVTMAGTPFIIASGPRIANLITGLPIFKSLFSEARRLAEMDNGEGPSLQDHLLIVGYGVNGRNVSRAAKVSGIPYMIIEMNPETVKQEKVKGEPIYYGDATQGAVLEHVGVHDARVMVIGVPDPVATRMIVASARNLSPRLHIIARTRFLQEMKPLYELGANEVIPEEFETSIEIFSRVLAKYLVPRDEIERFVAEVRQDGYGMFRSLSQDATALCDPTSCDFKLYLPDVEITTFRVKPGSIMDGKSLAQVQLRKKYGTTMLAIQQDSRIITNPDPNVPILAEDVSILIGSRESMAMVEKLFESPKKQEHPSEALAAT